MTTTIPELPHRAPHSRSRGCRVGDLPVGTRCAGVPRRYDPATGLDALSIGGLHYTVLDQEGATTIVTSQYGERWRWDADRIVWDPYPPEQWKFNYDD